MPHTYHARGMERAKLGGTYSGEAHGLNGRKRQRVTGPHGTGCVISRYIKLPWEERTGSVQGICMAGPGAHRGGGVTVGSWGKRREEISGKDMTKQGSKGRWECPVWPGVPGLKPEVSPQ